MPKGLRELQSTIRHAHGGKLLTALQELFNLGMDARQDPKVRVMALGSFVDHTAGLTGLASLGRQLPADESGAEGTEGELLERVADSVCRRVPELVEARLALVRGPKAGTPPPLALGASSAATLTGAPAGAPKTVVE